MPNNSQAGVAVTPNNSQAGGAVTPNNSQAGVAVTPNNSQAGVAVTPNKGQTGERKLVEAAIGDSLKLLALAGTFIYGALFLGYQAYYGDLGIHPEDVGVSHSFVLVRSIGFIILAVGIALVIVLYAYVIGRHRGFGFTDRLIMLFAYAIVLAYVRLFLPRGQPFWVLPLVAVIIFIPAFLLGFVAESYATNTAKSHAELPTAAQLSRLRLLAKALVWAHRRSPEATASAVARVRRWWPSAKTTGPAFRLGLAITIVLTVVLPAVVIDKRAHEAAEQTLRGEDIHPFTIFFGFIPVLDISSDHISATWICPEAQQPSVFGSKNKDFDGPKVNSVQALLLGETDTSLFMRVQLSAGGKKIIKLPQKCVMTAREPDD